MCWGGEGVVMETFCYHWCHEARPLYDFLDLLSQGYGSTVHIHTNVAYKNRLLSRSLYLFQAHGTWLNIPWTSGIWQGNGGKTECELKQSEALKEAEHQEGRSKSLSPSHFKVKVMYYCLLSEKRKANTNQPGCDRVEGNCKIAFFLFGTQRTDKKLKLILKLPRVNHGKVLEVVLLLNR